MLQVFKLGCCLEKLKTMYSFWFISADYKALQVNLKWIDLHTGLYKKNHCVNVCNIMKITGKCSRSCGKIPAYVVFLRAGNSSDFPASWQVLTSFLLLFLFFLYFGAHGKLKEKNSLPLSQQDHWIVLPQIHRLFDLIFFGKCTFPVFLLLFCLFFAFLGTFYSSV